ncbi:CDP-diacylglycerol--glycerol-3-phosphate 3-phosphatidyltransferase [Planctomyces sp. SH-PL14]|uniref:CDP-diacylglycerol--glycerol-3-phosphate 3-phosphatidyltransferase n=1 Tax=Planctomyces sp. SH-PL14 TaxID=1632864 RepID=UPI00078E84CA|nr:CDP-diacylglycerol--glycerol-3-phosphate 3-phosphatidyltransferase [Planctomyces sp. SH-PL14]AMV21379.1 CDP-diacylglycerol--glycerol-3-phosphate 3-phosphatidyltransferase [Planctomyces sp. SH-PL14]
MEQSTAISPPSPTLTQPGTPASRPTADQVVDARSLNLPNAITLSRLVLSVVLFGLIWSGRYWQTSAIVFIVAAATDFLDGYLARKYGQVTVLGRIMDPFVDKIIICGAFIFLQQWAGSGVNAWVTLIIVGREMFITSLRGFLEQRGKDFSAAWIGKWKMGVQCVAVSLALLSLSPEFRELWSESLGLSWTALIWLRNGTVMATVGITAYSGIEYTWRALRLLSE